MTVIGAYEAKTRLGELLDQVEAGESIVITRHGRPVAELRPTQGGRTLAEAEKIAAALRCKVAATDAEIATWMAEGRR